MSSLLSVTTAPKCFSCLRRAFVVEHFEPVSPARTQLRGKKTSKVPPTVKVRLLKDIRGWGRQGSVVPVAPGRMRNIWYPQKRAQYVTDAQLRTMKDVTVERDPLFGMEQIAKEQDTKVEPQLKLLSPQRASQIIVSHIPEYLDFYRSPIFTPEPEKAQVTLPQRNQKTSASRAASDLAAASDLEPRLEKKVQGVPIYGSVSTADIAASIKAALNLAATSKENEEAARVVLNAEDISVVKEEGADIAGDVDRIKSLGDFAVNIRVKGGESLFKYAQEKKFAIPAINVTSSSTVVASLEAARDKKAPIILQVSQGGAAYFAGKGVANGDQKASIAGAVAAAQYIRSVAPAYDIPVILHTDHCAKKLLPWLDGMMDADEKYYKEHGEPLFSSHMIDLSEEEVDWNISTTAKYLQRAAPMKQWLEMEIGITGGEEDGVNNEDVDNNSLYTQPEDIYNIYQTLSKISPYFSIAAGFGNVHGVYKPGNVKLHPELLSKHQKYVKDKIGGKEDKPVFLVFHGGSGSSKQEYADAISYGVVKVNLDTDLQYAYLTGIRDYVLHKKDYIMKQVGNPDGDDKPNKKYFDPRVWVREGEKTMSKRVEEGLTDFNTANQL